MIKNILKTLVTIFLVGLFACKGGNDENAKVYLTLRTTEFSGEIAHAWMRLASEMIQQNELHGPHAARIYGYLGLTLWESVCNGIPDAKSMAGQINDYPEPARFNEDQVYDWGIVVSSAMKMVLPELVDGITNTQRSAALVLAEQQENELINGGTTKKVFEQSRAYGTSIGETIVQRIHNDGRAIIRNIAPQLPTRDAAHAWYWDKNTYNQQPVEALWSTLRTFVTETPQVCEAAQPLAYSKQPGSPFYEQAKEVYEIAQNDNNRKLAYHFENGPGRTTGHAGHWINIAEQFLKKDGRDLAVCAKAYCLTGFAVADSYSAAWFLKYKFNLLRPATYIKEVFDPNWEPMVHTPASPEYISESATVGGAAPLVMISIFEDRTFVDRTHLGSLLYTPDGGPFILPERQFASIIRCGEEQAESGIVGGIQFRHACDEGLKAGRCIGNTILKRLNFGY